MDLLAAYNDDDDDQQQQQTTSTSTDAVAPVSVPAASASSSSSSSTTKHFVGPRRSINSSASTGASSYAPSVAINTAPDVPLDTAHSYYVNPQHNQLYYNPKVDELYSSIQGPSLPGATANRLLENNALGLAKNHQLGYVEPLHMSNYVFENNYHQFVNKGVASNPTSSSSQSLIFNSNRSQDLVPRYNPNRNISAEDKAAIRAKRKAANQDAGDVESWQGPWSSRETNAEIDGMKVEGRILTPEQAAERERVRAKKRKQSEAAAARTAAADGEKEEIEEQPEEVGTETSTFHGTEERDYQGRTYISPPSTLNVNTDNLQNYLPKRLVHTFTGHTKGVNAIKFFPTTGHLLLSASNDKTVKIWNVVSSAHGGYKCLRTYSGHQEAVRGIDFNYDGTRFMSCSFDKYVKLWDTETGQCIVRHTTKKIPYCVRIHPEAANSNEVLIGQHDKLVVTLDTRANQIVQTYNEHLGPVNTVTFIDGNKRFVSSSDDKKIFVWEYGIPVVIKHLAEPDMHSMPYIAVHPSGKNFVGQSQDNQILVFTAQNKYKLKRDKRFLGHLTAGYACEISFSPDGQFISSGDAQGRVVFWDWKSGKVLKKLKCHEQVSIGACWNPLESSKMATCSWDGTIKYWD